MKASLPFTLSLLFSAIALSQEPPVLRAIPVSPNEIEAIDSLTDNSPDEQIAANTVRPKTDPKRLVTPELIKPLMTPAGALPETIEGEDAVRVQIFLDQAMFGPGVIDGRPGQFTLLAIDAWNEVHGHSTTTKRPLLEAARKQVPLPFATALVPEAATAWVDPTLPNDRPGQAKKKRMSYRSYAEFMAERYHTDVDYLTKLNTATAIKNLKPRDAIKVPNVRPFLIENITGAKHEKDDVLSQRHVVVDTKMNQLRVFQAAPAALVVADPDGKSGTVSSTTANTALVASFPITPGKPKFIKFGTWTLLACVEFPYWRYDQQLLDTGVRSSNALNIPPGPNSPVGIIWCGLNKPGIGLHGTADPETIGRARSAGCIRLANWDAIRLPTLIRAGATVEIR